MLIYIILEVNSSLLSILMRLVLYIGGNRYWLYVASTDNLTYYVAHPEGWKASTEDIDIYDKIIKGRLAENLIV